jgi:hypothetical protein
MMMMNSYRAHGRQLATIKQQLRHSIAAVEVHCTLWLCPETSPEVRLTREIAANFGRAMNFPADATKNKVRL